MLYKERLTKDRQHTGLPEAVVTGTCLIDGTPAALLVMDFGFMSGSIGSVVGEKIALCLEMASKKKIPVIAVVSGGGSGVQEGILSLMQMAKTSIAANKLAEKNLPLITILTNPSTGQIYASFANLADIILSEPGALMGLSSLRTIADSTESPLPDDVHTAEFHLRKGHIDKIVNRENLKDILATLLDLLSSLYTLKPKRKYTKEVKESLKLPSLTPVKLAKHQNRPTSLDFAVRIFSGFLELHGDRRSIDDESMLCGIGFLGGQSVAVIGQNGRNIPAGFHKAQRIMKLAAKFNIPLLTLIDTPGPELNLQSEEQALGNTIATTMSLMASLPVPTIATLIGEGGSEGALCIGIADRVLMLEKAIYSAISPESTAALHKDLKESSDISEFLKISASSCKELQIIDSIVTEPNGGAHLNPNEAARYLSRALIHELAELQLISTNTLLKQRYKKFRQIGEYSSYLRSAASNEIKELQSYLLQSVKKITKQKLKKSN